MKKTINEIIVEFMNFLKIKYCFGIPGSNISLLEAIDRNKKLSLILTKHEAGAAFMASGYSKSSGTLSSCFGSIGPGATNLVTGIAAAYHDSQPILVLSGQVQRNIMGKKGFQESTGIGRTINQLKIFKNITKYAIRLKRKEDIFNALKNIYFAIKDYRPGPAYLEIPMDLMKEEIDLPNNFFTILELKNRKRLRGNNEIDIIKKIKKASRLINNSKRPAILIGGGAINYGKIIQKIAKYLSLPILTTLKGKGIVSENNPFCLGCIGITGQNSANEYINSNVDVLLSIGVGFDQFTTKNWTLKLDNTKIIRIDVPNKDITKNYKEEILIQWNTERVLNRLYKHLLANKIPAYIKKNRKNLIKEYQKKGYFDHQNTDSNHILKPQLFMLKLRKYLPKKSIVCSESVQWTEKYFKSYYPRSHVVCTGLAPIGCSLPEALGAKLANPNKTVVSIQGDGGFQMSAMELMTSINYNIPIISIVLNNGILGPVYYSEIKKYGRAFMTEFINPSFEKLSKGFGIAGITIKKESDIKKSIKKALNITRKGKSVLVEVIVGRENCI